MNPKAVGKQGDGSWADPANAIVFGNRPGPTVTVFAPDDPNVISFPQRPQRPFQVPRAGNKKVIDPKSTENGS